jgi:hypothetical protein
MTTTVTPSAIEQKRAPTITERFARFNSIAGYEECATQIILEGIAFAKSNDIDVVEDTSGTYDYFMECLRATFGFDNSKTPTKAEKRRAKYTIAIIFSNPANRDILVEMMVNDRILSTMITQLGDADGSKAKLLDVLRENARSTVRAVVGLGDCRDVIDIPSGDVSMDDTSDDSDDDEIINSMSNARVS